MTAADKYYLKALDYYPFNLEEVSEALEYGLSHDETHAGLLCMQAVVYHRYLKDNDGAAYYFSLTVYHHPGYAEGYYGYLEYLLDIDDLAAAGRLLLKAKKVKGISMARLHYLESLMLEKSGMYTEASTTLKKAIQLCTDNKSYEKYREERERIKQKAKAHKESCAGINITVK